MGARPIRKNLRKEKKELDPYRDTPIRFIGYCSEVGESLRYIFPRFVMPGYAIAFGYSCADTFDKGKRQFLLDGHKISPKLVTSCTDCLIW